MINNTKFSIAAMAMIVSSVPPMVSAEEKNGGFELHAVDAAFSRQLDHARTFMDKYKVALKKLAE